MIDDGAFDVLGDAPLAYAFGDRGALGFEHAGLVIAVERRTGYISKGDLDVLALGFETVGNPAQGATRADGGHKAIDLAAGVGPDLLAGGLDVGAAVGRIVPLVGPNGAIGLGFGKGLG